MELFLCGILAGGLASIATAFFYYQKGYRACEVDIKKRELRLAREVRKYRNQLKKLTNDDIQDIYDNFDDIPLTGV